MKRLWMVFVLALGVVVVPSVPANATGCPAIASDLSFVSTAFGSPPLGATMTQAQPLAASFRTGLAKTSLSGVTFAASVPPSPTASTNGYVSLDIWSDNGTGMAPGSHVGLIKRHAVVGVYSTATPVYIVTAKLDSTAPAIILKPSSTYWLAMSDAGDAPSGTSPVTWQASTGVPASSHINPGYSVGTTVSTATTWAPNPGGTLTPLFEVRACAV